MLFGDEYKMVYLFIHLFIYSFIYLSVCVFIIYLSACLFVFINYIIYLFISLGWFTVYINKLYEQGLL